VALLPESVSRHKPQGARFKVQGARCSQRPDSVAPRLSGTPVSVSSYRLIADRSSGAQVD